MTDRDTFAAAALTGLIASREWPIDSAEAAHYCYRIADAMLAARGTTDHDAAPAATASEAENQAVGRRAETSAGEAGTGDTRAAQEPVAWGVNRGDDIPNVYTTKEIAAAWIRAWPERNYRIFALYAAPPAGRVTLTDAEREVLSEARDDFEAGGFAAYAAVIDGLLARAAKEGR